MRTEGSILLVFTTKGTWSGYCVPNGIGGYNRFDLKGEWVGYLLPNSGKGYNLFTVEGAWIGFTT